jgi:hypothetical protein
MSDSFFIVPLCHCERSAAILPVIPAKAGIYINILFSLFGSKKRSKNCRQTLLKVAHPSFIRIFTHGLASLKQSLVQKLTHLIAFFAC